MTRKDDFDQTLEAWLRREAPAQAPDRVLDAALERVAVQSQQRDWLQRLVGGTPMTTLIRAAAVVAVVAFAAFLGYQISSLPRDIGASPEPTTSQSPVPSPSASPTPAADPAVGTLVLRLESGTDLGLLHVVTVLEDGRIITSETSTENPYLERRLTSDGVQLLRDELAATGGLTDASAIYAPVSKPGVEPPARGGVGHALTVGLSGGAQAVINWGAVAADEDLYYEPSPERETLDALALRLQTLDAWLPASAWADATGAPYEPARNRMFVEKLQWGGSLDELPVESSTVAWPLAEGIDAFGDIMQSGAQGLDEARCGVISAAEATNVIEALQSAGATSGDGIWIAFELGERANNRLVRITIAPVMPDETSCEGATIPV